MSNEERYKTALIVLANNLQTPGGYDMRPMASQMTNALAIYARTVINGGSLDEAARLADEANPQ